MRCDLHIHTTASDGSKQTHELIADATTAGLDVIAITDHDTLDGLSDINHSLPLKIINGIELSIDVPGNEVHILGLGIDPRSPAWTADGLIGKLKSARINRISEICSQLTKLGYPLVAAEVFCRVPANTAIGRRHIAEALLEKQLIPTIAYAFEKLIGITGPAYVKRYKLTIEQAVAVILQAGGTPIMAHPALCFDNGVVNMAIEAGVRGLEVYYPRHSKAQTEYYLSLCKKHNLVCSGGSDCHGKPDRFPNRVGTFYCQLPHKILEWL
jgi:hypothetical protein